MKTKMKAPAILGGVSLVLFMGLAMHVQSGNMQEVNLLFDKQVERWLHPILTEIMKFISAMGDWQVYALVTLVLLVLHQTRLKAGVPLAVAALSSVLLNSTLKNLFAVVRPQMRRLVSAGGYGFPSGHVMNGTVFVGVCVYLIAKSEWKRPVKIPLCCLCCVFMLFVGLSRLYLGVHTLTDVLGGYLMGVTVLCASVLVLQNQARG